MAFIGKTYKYVKGENMDEFLDKIQLPASARDTMKDVKPKMTFNKNGEEYTITTEYTPERTKVWTFTPGKEFEDESNGKKIKTVITIDGNTMNQVQTPPSGPVVTTKREFTATELKSTLTVSGWNGAAYGYYSAV